MGCNASQAAVEPSGPVHDTKLPNLIGKYGKPVDACKDTPASKDRGLASLNPFDEDIGLASLEPTPVPPFHPASFQTKEDVSSSLEQTKEAQLQSAEDVNGNFPSDKILPSEAPNQLCEIVAAISQRCQDVYDGGIEQRREFQQSSESDKFWEQLPIWEKQAIDADPSVAIQSTEAKSSAPNSDSQQAKRDLSDQPTHDTPNVAIEQSILPVQPEETPSIGECVGISKEDRLNQPEDTSSLRAHGDAIVVKSEVANVETSKPNLSNHPSDVSTKMGHPDELPIGEESDTETQTVLSNTTYASLDLALANSTDTQLMMEGMMDTIYTGVGDFSMGYIHACMGLRNKLALQDSEALQDTDSFEALQDTDSSRALREKARF